MSAYRIASFSDAITVSRVKTTAFVRRRVKAKFGASVLIAAMFPAELMYACARIAASQQWVTERGACVVLAGPAPRGLAWRRRGVYVASSAAVVVVSAALLVVPLLFGLFGVAEIVLGLLALWLVLLACGVVVMSSGSGAARRELRALRRERPDGWVVQDLASDGSSYGSSFGLAKAAVAALPEGSPVYAAAADLALAGLYKRWMEPYGSSGLVFYAITNSSETVKSNETHVETN